MLAWTDVESTGLDERTGHLLEVAVVVTDDDLKEVSAISTVVQPVGIDVEAMIATCDPIVQEMHTKNGLFAELRAGAGLRRWEAEQQFIQHPAFPWTVMTEIDCCKNCKKKQEEHTGWAVMSDGTGVTHVCDDILRENAPFTDVNVFVPKVVTVASQTPLAGSTIAFDRRWLREHMPKLEALFSYRSVDVSSFTEMAKRWAPKVYEGRPKAGAAHRALADVRESIEYLRYYRWCGFGFVWPEQGGACAACNIETRIGTEEVPHPVDRRLHTCESVRA